MRVPILYHIFKRPLPYLPTLALQESLHALQLRLSGRLITTTSPAAVVEVDTSTDTSSASTYPDVLLLLEHRPVYTAGRRQNEAALHDERTRLEKYGADWVATQRGGETTYHGPGQIVGYPLFDLERMGIRTREHVCNTQKLLEEFLSKRHGISLHASEHTGVFRSPTEKLASIGMQVRHRLTSHGFAVNITNEPLAWFERVIACGLEGVQAASVQSSREKKKKKKKKATCSDSEQEGCPNSDVTEEMGVLAEMFGETYDREIRSLEKHGPKEVVEAVRELEVVAECLGDWPKGPLVS